MVVAALPDTLLRERLALIAELARDLCHDANNQLAFVLSNLQNLIEYADDLTRVIAACRRKLDAAGARDAELRALEKEVDLEFLLEDAGRAAREGLEGAGRLRELIKVLAGLGEGQGARPMDLGRTIAGALPVVQRAVRDRAQLATTLPTGLVVTGHAGRLTEAVVAQVKSLLAAFAGRPKAENHIRMEATPRDDGGGALVLTHDAPDCEIGELCASAVATMGAALDVEPGRITFIFPPVA